MGRETHASFALYRYLAQTPDYLPGNVRASNRSGMKELKSG